MSREIVEQVRNAVLYSDGCIRIDNVRASYPHVDAPWAKSETDKAKYSITGLGDKETHGAVKDLCVKVINKLLAEKKMGKIGAEHKFCRDGDNAGKDECEGQWLFKASENPDKRPTVRKLNNIVATPEETKTLIYPGCYVSILIRPWAQDNTHGKKINANLIAVKFMRDGERFGEGDISDEDVWDEGGADDAFDDGEL